jgi:hypothetical protein
LCDYPKSTVPDDSEFEFLGSGVSRWVYRSKVDGRVYKIGQASCNKTEAEAAAWLHEHSRIPCVFWPTFIVHNDMDPDGWYNVSETDYIECEGIAAYNIPPSVRRALHAIGVTDLHGGNVWRWRGMIAVIDMGYAHLECVKAGHSYRTCRGNGH